MAEKIKIKDDTLATVLDSEEFNVQLSSFSGPLDLLCHLVEAQELDITRISLTDLVGQYVEFLLTTGRTPLSELISFFSFASKLILRKVHSLFPKTAEEVQDELYPDNDYNEDDLRLALENFIPYRNAATYLAECQSKREQYFFRECDEEIKPFFDLGDLYGLSRTWWDMLTRYQDNHAKEDDDSFDDSPWDDIPEVIPDEQLVDMRMDEIVVIIKESSILLSELLVEHRNSKNLIVTLLALLELSRMGIIRLIQTDILGDVEIVPK